MVGGGGGCAGFGDWWLCEFVGEREKDKRKRGKREMRAKDIFYIIWFDNLYYFNELYVKIKIKILDLL